MIDLYLKPIFEELYGQDGLTIIGRGLGTHLLFCKFIKFYSQRREIKKLVFCLNASSIEETVIEQLITCEDCSNDAIPKVINNKINSQKRSELYAMGGCFFITSRILIVDLLDSKVDPLQICGFLIYNAHRITETSIESFILRVYREKNRNGFIKAFSDEPEQLHSGFGKIERLLKNLYIKKLYLWPRFRLEICNVLEKRQPQVIELNQPLTNTMTAIQNAILVAMKTCLQELKKVVPSLDSSILSLENGLFQSFDINLRRQLDAEWHRISNRTKQLITDISILRKLLDYLIHYDPLSFYYLLMKLKAISAEQPSPSLWLTSEAADQIYARAKYRVYRTVPIERISNTSIGNEDFSKQNILLDLKLDEGIERVLECPPKWKIVQDIIMEILRDNPTIQSTSIIEVVVIVKDSLVFSQLRDVICFGDDYVLDQRYRWFISQQAAAIRNRAKVSLRNDKAKPRSYRSNPRDVNEAPMGGPGHGMDEEEDHHTIERNLQKGIDELERPIERIGQPVHCSSKSDAFYQGKESFQEILGLSSKELDMTSKENKLILLEERVLHMTPVTSSSKIFGFCSTGSEKSTFEDVFRSQKNGEAVQTKLIGEKRIHDLSDIDTNQPSEKVGESNKRVKIDSEEDIPHNVPTYLKAQSLMLNDHVRLQFCTHSQIKENFLALHQMDPSYVIMYDPDVTIIRLVECHECQKGSDTSTSHCKSLKVYFMMYEGSAEEHRYLSTLSKEKRAFESLILTKENMVISLPDHQLDLDAVSDTVDITQRLDSRSFFSSNKIHGDEVRNKRRKVVVDVREFRSTLPSILHSTKFMILPRTLNVGDYVLSPEICVERKGITDLFQSFASGRLYNQVEAMVKYYKYPSLLIEFTPDKPFCFMAANEISPDLQPYSITSRITLLIQTFPTLKLLWSRSPNGTGDIFYSICSSHEEVNVQKAVQVGNSLNNYHNKDQSKSNEAREKSDDFLVGECQDETFNLGQNDDEYINSGIFLNHEEKLNVEDIGIDEEQDALTRLTAQEILLSLPGINVNNVREVMHHVENLAELSKLNVTELTPLVGPVNALKLYDFLNK